MLGSHEDVSDGPPARFAALGDFDPSLVIVIDEMRGPVNELDRRRIAALSRVGWATTGVGVEGESVG